MQKKEDYFSNYIKTKNNILLAMIKKANNLNSEKLKIRIKDILITIIKKDKEKLKKFCFEGLPDEIPELRALIWKINLKYLNYEVDYWEIFLNKKRIEYDDIKSAFMLKMETERKIYEEFEKIESMQSDCNTYRNNQSNELKSYLKSTDRELLEEIDKDIRRTQPNFNFFSLPRNKDNLINFINEKRRSDEIKTIDDIYLNKTIETNADVLLRILYIYAKLNPDVGYVQGMNEIIASIFYCYSFDQNINENELEADAFWSFSYLMDDIKIIFNRKKDEVKGGIFSKINLLTDILKLVDKDIYTILMKNSVEISHFAFKWFILLFTQDFIMPDLIRLWDTVLCEKDKFYFIYYISIAILKIKKDIFKNLDFAGIILTIQNMEDLGVEIIINEVAKIRNKYENKIKKLFKKSNL